MTIVEEERAITGGVDTHADMHVAAALDPIGGLLGVQEFPRHRGWICQSAGLPGRFRDRRPGRHRGHGQLRRGPCRHMAAAGVRVVEVDRSDRQDRSLIVTGPDDLRSRFAEHTVAALVAELAALRPRPGDVPGYATRIALRELGRRAQFLDTQIGHLDELIIPLVTARAPSLLVHLPAPFGPRKPVI